MRTLFFLLMLLAGTAVSSSAQGLKPDWVSNYERGQSLEAVRPDAATSYWGIGVSTVSQDDANRNARAEFVKYVSTRIDVSRVLTEEERNGKRKELYESKISEISTARMGGVGITAFWSGDGRFYALILMPKDEYNKLVQEEALREVERLKIESARQIEEDRIKSDKEMADRKLALDRQQQEEELRAKKAQLAKERKERNQTLYGAFFKNPPPTRMVNALTAGLQSELMIKAAPFTPDAGQFFISRNVLMLQAWGMGDIRRDRELHNAEAGLRMNLLRGQESGHGLTLAAGFVGYVVAGNRLESLGPGNEKSAHSAASPAVYATYAMPELFFSHANVTVDARRLSAGLNARPLYQMSTLGEQVEALVQTDLIFNDRYRFEKNEAFVLHTGVRFNTSSKFSSVLAVENFRRFMVTLELKR